MHFYTTLLCLGACGIAFVLSTNEHPQAQIAAGNGSTEDELINSEELPPDVLIAIFGANRQYFLPYLLGAVEKFEYPKRRLALWVHEEVCPAAAATDGNLTTTGKRSASTFSNNWFEHFRDQYHASSVSTTGMDGDGKGEKAQIERQTELHEAALALARDIKAGAVLFLDPSCMLFEPGLLRELQLLDGDIVAPLLASYMTRFTNYWCKLNDDGEYVPSDACEAANRNFVVQAEMHVDSIHSCYMLKSQKALSHVTFRAPSAAAAAAGSSKAAAAAEANACAKSSAAACLGLVARRLSLQMVVSSKRVYGYMIPPSSLNRVENNNKNDSYTVEEQDWDQLALLQLHFYTKHRFDILQPSSVVVPAVGTTNGQRPKHFRSSSISHVAVINLDRRPDRMNRMKHMLDALGIGFMRIAAVDGKMLAEDHLHALGIRLLPEYRAPHRNRPMTRGEIGCFLSHYAIWQQIAAAAADTSTSTTNNAAAVLVLEDDARFVPYFTRKLHMLLADAQRTQLDWDLLYLARRRVLNDSSFETHLAASIRIVHADYSFWTLAYLLTPRGARKLLHARPLERLVPVDEFLPIMYNRHPILQYSAHFAVRNLLAYSAAPLLVEPLFHTGDGEYVSDTDNSSIVVAGGGGGGDMVSVPTLSNAEMGGGFDAANVDIIKQSTAACEQAVSHDELKCTA